MVIKIFTSKNILLCLRVDGGYLQMNGDFPNFQRSFPEINDDTDPPR